MAITLKEQAQSLYDEFAVILHPLYHELAIHMKDGRQIKIKCKQAKECAKKAAEIIRDNCDPGVWGFWNEVIVQIDKINEEDKKEDISE